MTTSYTYTISEAAGLTGRHPNTIRQKIRLGQLDATVQIGKYGEEYRIPHEALVRAGLLEPHTSGAPHAHVPPYAHPPTRPSAHPDAVLDAELIHPEEQPAPAAEVYGSAAEPPGAALGELFQRHEQAMFRLGYLQGEMERLKALADTAESLRTDRDTREKEVQDLRATLDRKEREAEEVVALRSELESARARLSELEVLRGELEELKRIAEQQEQRIAELNARRGSWAFWRR